jgi:hypothetical protein
VSLNGSLGNVLLVLGIALALLGLLLKTGVLGWFGNLPGDITVRRDGFSFYLPITSMILVSVVLSLLLAVVRRLW